MEIMSLVGMMSKPLHVRRLQKALQEWVANPGKAFNFKNHFFQLHLNHSDLKLLSLLLTSVPAIRN